MTIYEQFLTKRHQTRPVYDFRELVYKSEKDFATLPAFILRERTVTYTDFARDYRALCTKFFELGYEGKRIAISGANSYNWIICYLAAATVGVAVPIDKELMHEDIEEFLRAADCVAVFADSTILCKLETDIEKYTIAESKQVKLEYTRVSSLIEEGYASYLAGNKRIDSFEINREEMSILIFTSGTTGSSKGVMLSQRNICANINQTSQMVKIDPTLHSLSVLPLHHTYETTLGHLLLLSGGSCISYADGLRQVAKNISEYQPSVLIVVPLLLDFILNRVEANMRKSLPKMFLLPEGASVLELLKHLPAPLRFIVKRKVKKTLGGRLRLLIVGAAPIKPEVIETFCMLGITTYQGYGLTETAPLIAGNNDFFMNPAAVGLPIHDVEIKIENPNEEGVGEIITRGDNVMLGYFNDELATAEAMRGGYFHTGDLGYFDADGFLYVTGRCKNVIVAQNGKNIYPEELEARLNEELFIEESLVLGVANTKGGTAIKAKIYPCIEKIKELYDRLPTEEEIRAEIAKVIERVNEKLPAYKKIVVTEIVWEAFEKTTTKKIKRFGANMA
ncbi:MAG: AMP-binding protein [Clostridia bacterium]|nr:AMP-binding protein [Clostridia bacterium]